jgi:hypothetical protein
MPPPIPPSRRQKTATRRAEAHEPRLPHERDESADSQHTGEPRQVIRQAAADLAAGRVDTDRGPVTDQVYRRQKQRR